MIVGVNVPDLFLVLVNPGGPGKMAVKRLLLMLLLVLLSVIVVYFALKLTQRTVQFNHRSLRVRNYNFLLERIVEE